MKLNLHKSLFAGILLCCGFLEGCEKEVIIPDIEGNIVGYLYTSDEFGLLADHSDVRVSTRGLEGSYSTLTDKNGRFELSGVSAGTYELTFSKEGFVSDTLSGVKHLGGQPTILGGAYLDHVYRLIYLYKIPVTTIENISIENDSVIVEFNFSGNPGRYISLMFYVSQENGFEKNAALIFSEHLVNRGNVYKMNFPYDRIPYDPGEVFYLKAAVLSDGHTTCATIDNNGNYINCEYSYIFYPVLGDESDQFSLVVPE